MTSGAPRALAPVSANADWVRALQRTAEINPQSTRTLSQIVRERAGENGVHDALVGENATLTYAALATRSEAYAGWASCLGLSKGDRVALLLDNQPDYVAIWLGLSSLGIVTALLNTQLVDDGLAHGLALAEASHLIAGAPFVDRVRAIGFDGKVWVHGADRGDLPRIDDALEARGSIARPEITLADPALLIYTSGTTGLPKAAHVSHFRIVMWSEWFAGVTDAGTDDRLYDCLPMYHSVGGIVAIGAMLAAGGTAILRTRFSTTAFWSDIVATRATMFQYIGELCRYLVAAPPDDAERDHTLRLCVGNGLRADIWENFATRFAIPRIIEFYAATEGSFSLFNLEGRIGAIGRIPRFMAHRSPVALVRFDPSSQCPIRGDDGFCVTCETGEAGEAIGRISDGSGGLATRFEGYTGEAATEAKILRDVFTPEDAWFRTGDLMRQDAAGFFYFVDRIGDTFRWKGENVATTEVVAALSSCPSIVDATVYGVTVPGADGRAGMAALVATQTFDPAILHEHLATRLPRYARPVFLRITSELAVTGTFKPQTQDLIRDGFDPARTIDALYVDVAGRGYRRLDAAFYDAISSGALRL